MAELVHQANIPTDKKKKKRTDSTSCKYLLFIPTTVMNKVFHLLVLYGNLYTLEQRRRVLLAPMRTKMTKQVLLHKLSDSKHAEISMHATEIPGSNSTAETKLSNTSCCLFTDLEGLSKATVLSYPKGHLQPWEGSKTPEEHQINHTAT